MPDLGAWISQIKREEPPEYWGDVRRLEGSTPPEAPRGTRRGRVGAMITGVALGGLALVLATQAFDRPATRRPPPPPVAKANGLVAFLRIDPRSAVQEGGPPETALFAAGPQGLGVDRVVAGVDRSVTPAWSPDGRRIAYGSDGDLRTVDIGTRASSVLVACERPACQDLGPAAWSPQGTRVAFGMLGPRGNGLWVSDADGTGARLLRKRIWFEAPAWSSDGRLLAVIGYIGDEGDFQNEGIFVIDAESGAITRTIPLPGLDAGFTIGWSPDGRWLVFDALGEGGVEFSDPSPEAGAGIYLVRPDGTDRRLLTSWACEEDTCMDPAWSPDGREIVFTRSLPELGSDGSLGDLYVIDVESGDVRRLTRGPGLDCCASWQPLPAGSEPPIIGAAACARDTDRRNASPTDEPRAVSVYFSCEADAALLGAEGQPVYMFARSVPAELSGTPDGRLEAALRTYFAGPTPEEAELGYFTPAPAALGAAIQEVSISEGTATVDFDATAGSGLGNLGTSTASLIFLTELRAVAFQFPDVQSLVLLMNGDCDSFWHVLEMSCQTIRRTDPCPSAQLAMSRLPWLPLGAAVPDPEFVEDELGPVLVWFEDVEQRWAGRYVALKRSSESVVGEDLSDFPTAEVRGETAHLVWIGDPGVGELALVWDEGVQPCSWFSLSMSSVRLTQQEAERTIRGLAAYVVERSP